MTREIKKMDVVYAEEGSKYLYLDGSAVPKGAKVGVTFNDIVVLNKGICTYENLR